VNQRSVYKTPDGWADRNDNASRPASIHQTQAEAQASARQHLVNAGGGELVTHGTNGQIRAKDTVAPGNDPCPPKG
jgi:hypothetical protein